MREIVHILVSGPVTPAYRNIPATLCGILGWEYDDVMIAGKKQWLHWSVEDDETLTVNCDGCIFTSLKRM